MKLAVFSSASGANERNGRGSSQNSMYIKNDLKQAKINYFRATLANGLIGIMIVLVVMGFAVKQVPTYTSKASLTELLTLIPTIKIDLIAEYSYLGHWPKSDFIRFDKERMGNTIKKISFDGKGTINVYFSGHYPMFANKVLSFMANVHPSSEIDSILWTCGYASPVDGFYPTSTNNTTIDSKLLPTVCKRAGRSELSVVTGKKTGI